MKESTREKHHVRVLNPAKRERERNLVRVVNPEFVGTLLRSKSDEDAHQLFQTFRGKEPKSIRVMEARESTPATVAELGGLVEIVFDDSGRGRRPRARMTTLRALKFRPTEDDAGDKVLAFDAERVKLVAGGEGRMHIVGFYRAPPDSFEAGRAYFLGCVLFVTYRSDKPHIETGERDYYHEFAEDGGELPRLYYKDGYLLFHGGTYRITKWGIDG